MARLTIFIPTRGRVGDQKTLDKWKLKDAPFDVVVVVPKCERKAQKKALPSFVSDIVTVPDEYRFPQIRQFIMETFEGSHLLLDDDLVPFRRMDGTTKLRNPTDEQFVELWDELDNLSDLYAHGAISAREGNNHVLEDMVENSRAMRAHFYDSAVMRETKLKFTDSRIKEDFHSTLWMLTRGYENCVLYKWAQNQSGSNTAGGCSRYRTDRLMTEDAHALHNMYPDFVTVVQKTTKSSWGGGTRTDVRIQWKKAFQSSQGKSPC